MPFCRQVEPLSDADKYFNMLEWVCRGQNTQQWLAAPLSVSEGLSPTVSTKQGWDGRAPRLKEESVRRALSFLAHKRSWRMLVQRGCMPEKKAQYSVFF